jgi:hypothetical protein
VEQTTQLNTQTMEALLRANEVRLTRAEDKRMIKAGRLNPATILRCPPPHWQRAKLVDLLVSMPKVGRVKAGKWCRHEHLSMERHLGELTQRQRGLLAAHLDIEVSRRDAVRAALQVA